MDTTDVRAMADAWNSDVRAFQLRAPVDVREMAEGLGLNVWRKSLTGDVSGMILRDHKHGGKAGYSIFVNAAHPRTRQRFTIAHEIAHFLLHRDRIGDGIEDDALLRSGLSTLEEVQANKLAAKILMPLHLLRREMNAGTRKLPELARKFGVSPQAMSIRLGLPY